MEISWRCVRPTLGMLAVAGALTGCTSGTDAVPIPGADHVVTAPVASLDLPPTTAQPGATVPPPEQQIPATAPAVTDSPAPSTTAQQPPVTTVAPPATDAAPDDVFLRLGDEGPEVGVMQLKLSVLGYLPAGSDTGVFDEATRGGLRGFQADYGLGVDGIFGPLTGRALNAAVQSVNVES